jgi:NADPH:quinone reductase
MAAAVLAKRRGLTVLSTTRSPAKADALTRLGVDHVLVDNGSVADRVRALFPDGVDGAIELVGTLTLPDTLRATKVHGTVCFTGMLSGEWTVADFYPIDYLPPGVRLTAYSGDADNLSADVLQGFLDDVAAGRAAVPVDRVFTLDQIREAHSYLESGASAGKLVVLLRPEGEIGQLVGGPL